MAEDNILEALKDKVSRVIERARRAEDENLVMQAQIKSLSDAVKEKNLEIAALKESYNRLKLAKALASSDEDARSARQQIGKIVREIDRCISLLNR